MKLFLYKFAGNGKRPSFGNNLFGYFVMKIIQQQYGHVEVGTKEELDNPMEVSDAVWDAYSEQLEKDPEIRHIEMYCRDLFLFGFYQNCKPLYFYKEYLRSLLHSDNQEYITPLTEPHVVRVSDIANTQITDPPGENDMVLHLRLGDFKHNGGTSSEIIHPSSYFSILDTLSFEKLIIVVKAPEEPFEFKYLDLFKQRYTNVVIRSSTNLLEDFVYLMKSNRIIISNSTFCWIAAFLGKSKENYVIRNTYYKGQILDQVNENSILCPVRYITPEEILAYN
jgi:hypothetical protein